MSTGAQPPTVCTPVCQCQLLLSATSGPSLTQGLWKNKLSSKPCSVTRNGIFIHHWSVCHTDPCNWIWNWWAPRLVLQAGRSVPGRESLLLIWFIFQKYILLPSSPSARLRPCWTVLQVPHLANALLWSLPHSWISRTLPRFLSLGYSSLLPILFGIPLHWLTELASNPPELPPRSWHLVVSLFWVLVMVLRA